MDPDQSQTSEAELIREREAELGPRRAGGMDPDKEAEPTPFLERRMPSSPFPAIADYAFLSDCHTGALVAPDGTIEWLCPPRFDSPSVFAALLDRSAGGWRFGPSNMGKPVGRRYEPGTNIVETTWMTPTGWMIVRDALILGLDLGVGGVGPAVGDVVADGAREQERLLRHDPELAAVARRGRGRAGRCRRRRPGRRSGRRSGRPASRCVDLPAPVSPTKATVSPGRDRRGRRRASASAPAVPA